MTICIEEFLKLINKGSITFVSPFFANAMLCAVKFQRKMFNLFEKKTKWQPLVAYNASGTDYIVFVRKGLKSGMIYFKTKRNTPFGVCSYNFNATLFDIKKQFDDVLSA